MPTIGRIGVSFPTPAATGGREVDPSALRLRKLEQKNDADKLRDQAFITGTKDSTRPPGSPLTDGITLQAGATIELAHGLGRQANGIVPIITAGATSALTNDVANISKGLEKTHVRVKNTGGSPVTFKLRVV